MTADEEAEQMAASQQHFQRFIHTITGEANEETPEDDEILPPGAIDLGPGTASAELPPIPDLLAPDDLLAGTGSLEDGTEGELEFLDDIPLNEFEWEQELRDADRRAEQRRQGAPETVGLPGVIEARRGSGPYAVWFFARCRHFAPSALRAAADLSCP